MRFRGKWQLQGPGSWAGEGPGLGHTLESYSRQWVVTQGVHEFTQEGTENTQNRGAEEERNGRA